MSTARWKLEKDGREDHHAKFYRMVRRINIRNPNGTRPRLPKPPVDTYNKWVKHCEVISRARWRTDSR